MFSYPRGLKTEAKRAMAPLARRMSRRASALPIELWGMYVDAEGRLCYAGRDVLGLVQEAGETPVHLLDAARLDANLAAFQRSGAEVYYSFKTQPLPWVIRRLMALGAGAEVISEYELRLALHLGAPAHKIIFNGPGKTDASIRLAIESQIFLFNSITSKRWIAWPTSRIRSVERFAWACAPTLRPAGARSLDAPSRVAKRCACISARYSVPSCKWWDCTRIAAATSTRRMS